MAARPQTGQGNPAKATITAASVLLVLLTIGGLAFFWRAAEDRARVELGMARDREQHLVETRTLLADALLERGIHMAVKHDVSRGLHWMVRSLEVAEAVGDADPSPQAIAEGAVTTWPTGAKRQPGRSSTCLTPPGRGPLI